MTSEIVIMTSNAIAMAADSAVTVYGSKTYNGVNKLFMLSNSPSVGIMFYNNTNFLEFPYETIIKEFRNSIKDQYNSLSLKKILKNNKDFSSVSDFQLAFQDYLKSLIKNSRSKISFENQFKVFLGKLPNIIIVILIFQSIS